MKLVSQKTRFESLMDKAEFYLGFNPLQVVFLSIAFMSLFAIGAFVLLIMLNMAMEIQLENNL